MHNLTREHFKNNTGKQDFVPEQVTVFFVYFFPKNKTVNRIFLSVQLAYVMDLKESYKNITFLLDNIKYEEFKWNIYGDLK